MAEKTFPLRIEEEILKRIEGVAGYQPKYIWITEAIEEKLKREENKNA